MKNFMWWILWKVVQKWHDYKWNLTLKLMTRLSWMNEKEIHLMTSWRHEHVQHAFASIETTQTGAEADRIWLKKDSRSTEIHQNTQSFRKSQPSISLQKQTHDLSSDTISWSSSKSIMWICGQTLTRKCFCLYHEQAFEYANAVKPIWCNIT